MLGITSFYTISVFGLSHTGSLKLEKCVLELLHVKVCEVHTNFICNPKSTKICCVMITCEVQ